MPARREYRRRVSLATATRRIARAGLALVILLSCESTGGFSDLAQRERARFTRCWSHVRPSIDCGIETAGLLNTACQDRGKRWYSHERTESARRAWLVMHGCPPPMVGVQQH